MRTMLLVCSALTAGFVGGAFGTFVVHSLERRQPEQVVRAHRFELVDETGDAISFWGIDKSQYAILAFGSYWLPQDRQRNGRRTHLDLNEQSSQRAAFGVVGDSPFLLYGAPDGKPRMSLSLSIREKPFLWMADESGRRLSLGIEHSDTMSAEDNTWALDFSPSHTRIGTYPAFESGVRVTRGFLMINGETLK